MQSKGTLGSIIAGIIAIFLVLVCLFYLSFTLVSSKQEAKAEQYALSVAGQQGKNSEQYNKAYKAYIDSISKEPVWLGYNYSEVQKWGVGLGLDLKGGMNVILQVSMPDMLRSMKTPTRIRLSSRRSQIPTPSSATTTPPTMWEPSSSSTAPLTPAPTTPWCSTPS